MALVVDSRSTNVVVVERSRTATAIVREIEAVNIAGEMRTAVPIVREIEVINVAGVGIQGRPGEKGEPGAGDNETFDTDLTLLYNIAKL